MKDVTNQAVRAAIDDCLSGVESMPSVRAQVLNQVRGEVKVKKKLSVGIVFAMLLTVLMAGAALAAGLGLFGQIGERENSDARLPALERVAESVGASFTTDDGVTIAIDQAYYDGSRVFISYAVDGAHDVLEMGTGDPGIVNYDREETGVRFKEQYFVDGPNGKPLMGWLDGSEPRWATRTVVNVHDGLQIGEEYLDIIGGEYYWLEDGTLMGWKECEVPAGLAADEVTFSIGVFTHKTTRYQTADTLYTAYLERGKTTWHEFTVKKNELATALTGTTQTADWTATANLTASAIDLKGEIVLDCPASWSEVWRTWENPNQIDFIEDWKLYVDGKKVEGHNLDGSSYGSGPITFMVCYQMEQLSSDIMLVPDYWYGGEKPDEAIHLTIAK